MADRKPILGAIPQRPELDRLFEESKSYVVSDAELQEQRVSFAYEGISARSIPFNANLATRLGAGYAW